MEVAFGGGSSDDLVSKRDQLARGKWNGATHVDGAVPMLSSGALDKPGWSLDRCNSALFRQNEFLELGAEMRCPAVGGVDDCSCAHFSARSGDSDPAVAVFVRNVQDWGVGLQVQVAFLEQLLQECVNELVSPSVEKG